jgi:hypothetical protein
MMTPYVDKLDRCPECDRALSQQQYDVQACTCGWGPFGLPSKSWQLLDALAFIHEQGKTK